MKSPAFQVYVNDFLGSTKVGVMSTEEIGAYWLLLFLDWQDGGFVFDETALSRWCRLTPGRFRRAWVALAPCFAEEGGRFYNPRLQKERAKQAAWKDKSSKAGHLGAEKRWGKASPNDNQPHKSAMAEAGVKHDIPFPLPSPKKTSPGKRGGWVGRFGDAWTTATKGTYPPGQLGKELKGLIDRDGEDKVFTAWLGFSDSEQRKFGGAYFAKHYGDFSGDMKPKLVGVGGDLSLDELRTMGINL